MLRAIARFSAALLIPVVAAACVEGGIGSRTGSRLSLGTARRLAAAVRREPVGASAGEGIEVVAPGATRGTELERTRALQQLLDDRGDAAHEAVVDLLESAAPDVVLEVLSAIVWRREARFFETITGLLDSPDETVRRESIRALFDLNRERARGELAGMLTDAATPFPGREKLLGLLVTSEDDVGVVAVCMIALEDAEGEMREAVVARAQELTLQEFRADDTLAWHQWWRENREKSSGQWMRDLQRDRRARERARDELAGETREQLVTFLLKALARRAERSDQVLLKGALEMPYPSVKIYALGEISELGLEELSAEVLALLADTDPRVRTGAIECATRLELTAPELDSAGRALIRLLKDDPACEVRAGAVRALGRLGVSRAIPYLIDALDTDTAEVRAAAAWSLGELKASESADFLVSTMREDDAVETRAAAAEALGKIGESQPLADLARTLTGAQADGAEKVRFYAAQALGALGGADAQQALVAALADASQGVRIAALGALGDMGTESAISALRERLGVDEEEERDAAWRALKRTALAQGVSALGLVEELVEEQKAYAGELLDELLETIEDPQERTPAFLEECAGLYGRLGEHEKSADLYKTLLVGDPTRKELWDSAHREMVAAQRFEEAYNLLNDRSARLEEGHATTLQRKVELVEECARAAGQESDAERAGQLAERARELLAQLSKDLTGTEPDAELNGRIQQLRERLQPGVPPRDEGAEQ